MNIEDKRPEYLKSTLNTEQMHSDPVEQFEDWFDEANNSDVPVPTAMSLATADAYGKPSSRIVLLKGFDKEGFVFYTSFSSRKGTQLEANPYASLLFFWPELERQIRLEGAVKHVTDAQADAYFASRPFESKLSAFTSPQSQPVPNRRFLEQKVAENRQKYSDGNVPRPEGWGGYRVIPEYFEFWQGRANRLHDRFSYTLTDGQWKLVRLAP